MFGKLCVHLSVLAYASSYKVCEHILVAQIISVHTLKKNYPVLCSRTTVTTFATNSQMRTIRGVGRAINAALVRMLVTDDATIVYSMLQCNVFGFDLMRRHKCCIYTFREFRCFKVPKPRNDYEAGRRFGLQISFHPREFFTVHPTQCKVHGRFCIPPSWKCSRRGWESILHPRAWQRNAKTATAVIRVPE